MKKNLIALSVASLFFAGAANAVITPGITAAQTWAAQDVAANSTILSTTAGVIIDITGTATEDFTSKVIKIELPAGLTFKKEVKVGATESIRFTFGGTGLTKSAGGGVGDNSVTLSTDATTTTGGARAITLQDIALNGTGSPLATANADLTVKVTVGTTTTSLASTFLSKDAFEVVAGTNSDETIDIVTTGVDGKKFIDGKAHGTLATGLKVANATGAINAIGQVYTPATSSVRTASLVGNVSAYSDVYLSVPACAATVPTAAIKGTIAGDKSSVAFTGLDKIGVYNVCVIADGKTLIPSSTYKTTAKGVDNQIILSANSTTDSKTTYNGSHATAYNVNPASNTTNPGYVQLFNRGTEAVKVSGIQSTTAGVESAFIEVVPSIPAKGSVILSSSQLEDKLGELKGKGTVKFFANGGELKAQTLVLRPDGGIANVGGVQADQ